MITLAYPSLAEIANILSNFLIYLIALMFLDWALGMIAAAIQGRFEWDQIARVFVTDGLLIIAWAVFEVVVIIVEAAPQEAQIPAVREGLKILIETIGYKAVGAAIVGSILKHISAFGLATDFLRKIKVTPSGENPLRPMG